MNELTHGSLFTGFGMFDYAAQMAGLQNVWQVEINEFCQKLLAVRFPDARRYRDIKSVRGEELGYVNVISGGFPCQPHSIAGKRKGREDERNLFPEMLRVIGEGKPEWVLGENVYGILNTDDGKFFEQEVIAPLEDEGYSVQPYIIPASAIGAVHRRDRLWIVAQNTKHIRCNSKVREEKSGKRRFGQSIAGNDAGILSQNSRLRNDKRKKNKKEFTDEIGFGEAIELERPTRCDELRITADTTNERLQKPEEKRIGKSLPDVERGDTQINPDPDNNETSRQRRNGGEILSFSEPAGLDGNNWERNWFEVAAELCRVDASPSAGLHKPRYRKQRLEGLGNGIQWEIAYIFFQLIKEFENKKCSTE